MSIADVAIVGAGPAGLLLYDELTSYGLSVVLLEGGCKPKAEDVAPEDQPRLWPYRSNHHAPLNWHRTHAIGGRTIGWGGFCFRFSPFTLEHNGWPYGARTLAPFYASAEKWIGMVEGRLLPQHRNGARSLGWSMLPLRGARVGKAIWAARHSAAARAARTEHLACSLSHDGVHVSGLNIRHPDGSLQPLTAKSFILAGAPVETTRLLFASGLSKQIPRLGKGLVRHPAVSFMLFEPHPLPGDLNPIKFLDGGLLAFPEKGFALEIIGPQAITDDIALELRKLDLPHVEAGRCRVTYINAMSETEANPKASVTMARGAADDFGRPIPKINLAVTPGDKVRIKAMKEHCLAFAQAVATPGAQFFMMQDVDTKGHFFHEAGICAMGLDGDSPCDPWGRLRALDNVWIADASVFPSAGDRHPTLTVLAHALRVARDVARVLKASKMP